MIAPHPILVRQLLVCAWLQLGSSLLSSMSKTFYRPPQPSLSGNRKILLIASYLALGRDAARAASHFGVAPQLVAQLLAEIKAQGLLAWCMVQRDSDLSSSRNQELLKAEAESGGRLQRELEQLDLLQIDAFRLAIGAALERHYFTLEAVAKLFHVPKSDVFNFQRKLRAQGYDKWLAQYTKQDIALVQPEVKVTMSPFLTDTAPRLERSRAAHPPVNGAGAAQLFVEGHSAQPMSGERRIHITLTALSQVQTVSDLSARFQIPAMQIEAWQQEAQTQGIYQWCKEQRKRDEADQDTILTIARERLQAKHRLDDYTLAYAQVIAVGAVLDQKVSVAKAAKIFGLNEEGLKRLVKQAQGQEREAWAQQLLNSVPKPTAPKSIFTPTTYKSPRPTASAASRSALSSAESHQPRIFGSKQAPAPSAGTAASGVAAASVAATARAQATNAQTASQSSHQLTSAAVTAAATSSAAVSAPRVFGAHPAQQTEQQDAAAKPAGSSSAAALSGGSVHNHKSHRLSQLKRQTLLTAKSHQSGAQATSSVSAAAQAGTINLTGADRISLLAAYVDKQFSLGKLTASSGLSADDLAQLEAEAKEQGLIKWCLEQHRRDQCQKLKSSLNLFVSCDIPWFTAAALSAVRAQQYSLETVTAILNLDQDELRAQLESQPLSQAKSTVSRTPPESAAAQSKRATATTTQVQILSAPAPELKTPTAVLASGPASAAASSAHAASVAGKDLAAKDSAAQQKLVAAQASVVATASNVAIAPNVVAANVKTHSASTTQPQPAQPQAAPRASGEQIIFGQPPVAELSAPEAHLASLSQSMATLAATAPRTKIKFKYPHKAQLESAVTAAAKAEFTPAQASAGAGAAAMAPQLSGVDRIRLVAAQSCEPCDYAKLQAESGLSREQLEALQHEALAQGLIPWCQAQHQLDQEHHAQAQLPQLKQKVDCTASDLFGQAAAEAVHAQGLSPEQVAQLLLFENAEDVSVLVDLYYSDAADKAPQETPAAVPTEHSTGAGATDLKPVAVTEASAAPIKASPAAVPETTQSDATVPAAATSFVESSQDAAAEAVAVVAPVAASAKTSADSVLETTPADVAVAHTANTSTFGAQSPANQAVDAAVTVVAAVESSVQNSADSVPKSTAAPTVTATNAFGPALAVPPHEDRPVKVNPAQAAGSAAQDAPPDAAAAALSALNGANRIALAAAFLSGKFTPEQLSHAAPGLTPDALTRLKAELNATDLLEWCIDQRYLDQKQGLGSQLTLKPELLVERAALVEFRAAAVQGVLTKKMAATQVAALLDLAESSVTTWVQEARAQGYEAWLETARERLQQAQERAVTVSSEPQLRPVSGRRLIELVAAHYAKGFSPRLLGQIVGVSAATIESCLAQLKEQGLYAWCHSQCLADRNDPKLSQLLAREDEHPLPPDFQVERMSLAPFKHAALQALRAPGNSPEAVGDILGLDPVQIKAWFLAEARAADNAAVPQAPEPVVPAALVAPAETVASEVTDAAAPELKRTALQAVQEQGHSPELVAQIMGLKLDQLKAWLKPTTLTTATSSTTLTAAPGKSGANLSNLSGERCLRIVAAYRSAQLSSAELCARYQVSEAQVLSLVQTAQQQGLIAWAKSQRERDDRSAEAAALARRDCVQLGLDLKLDEVAGLRYEAARAVLQDGMAAVAVAALLGLRLPQLMAWVQEAQDH